MVHCGFANWVAYDVFLMFIFGRVASYIINYFQNSLFDCIVCSVFLLFFVLVGYFYIFVHVQHNHNIRGDFGISSMFTNEKRRIDKKREKRSHIAPFITSIDILMHLKTLADLRIRFLLFPYKLFCFVSTFGLFSCLCNIPSTIFVNDLAWFSFYKFYECVILSPLKTVLHAFDIQ